MILYVEDERDLREMTALALETEGYTVKAVASAEEALAALESDRYDVLVTDYRLPRESGAWLLRQATRRGYLDHMPAIVLSGEASPPDVDAYPFLRKPVDFEALCAVIRASLAPSASLPTAPESADMVLVLYMAPSSPESQKALRRLRRTLSRYEPRRIDLQVVDASVESAVDGLEEDRIVATPTLVKKHPGPKMWVMGNLSNTDVVEEMISTALDSDQLPHSV